MRYALAGIRNVGEKAMTERIIRAMHNRLGAGVKSFDLLSDNYPYGEVAKKYGVFRETDGISERAVFVIDKSGKVTWSKVYDIPQQPENTEIFDALAALGRS